MPVSDSRSSLLLLCGCLLLLFLTLPTFCQAQFTPTLSTTLDNLDSGQASGFIQDGFFFEGQEGPSSMLIQFDRGSFDFSGYAPGQLVGSLVVEVFVSVIFVTISGDIIADVQVTSVGPDTMQAIAVITDITGNVSAGLSLLGIDLNIGDIAFDVLYTDLSGDSGATMNVTDAGSLPLSGNLDFDIPLTWTTAPILTHSPSGGDLTVETLLTSTTGIEASFNEVFPLTGGTTPDPDLFNRGDANQDGTFDISDPITMLGFLFNNLPVSCVLASDANDDNGVDIADAVFCLSGLFGSGAQPPAPHGACGEDPTPGSLSCLELNNNCP